MSHLKLIVTIFSIITFGTVPTIGQAGNIEFVTYYPAPQGVYNRVSLLAQSSLPASCDIGSFMVEQSSGKIYYCHNVSGSGSWGPISNVWTVSGNYVYPTQTDTNPLIFAGVGTSTPSFKLALENDGGILALGTFGAGTVTSYPINPVDKTAPANSRLIWYPHKAVFRAIADRFGVSDDTQMGNYSVGFGDSPVASATATVTAGVFNTSSASYATVAGGQDNIASGNFSTVTGGMSNSAAGSHAVISGESNGASGNYSTISGGKANQSSTAIDAAIAGGTNNTISADGNYTSIAGGIDNLSSGEYTALGGGKQNQLIGFYSVIAGGRTNISSGNYSFIGGGISNTTFGQYSTIGGGSTNSANGVWSFIAGGSTNSATNDYSTVLGGENNTTSGISSFVAGGSNNIASGNYSVIAGGNNNTVAGDYSWASGRNMNLTASADRTFVWGYSEIPVNITTQNAFILAAGMDSNGFPFNPKLGIGETNPTAILSIKLSPAANYLAITSTTSASPGNIFIVDSNNRVGIGRYNPSYPLHFGTQANGAYLTAGGVWTNTSSRKFKDNIKPLDPIKAKEILQKLNPVTFNYKKNPSEHHVGFIAEDVPDLLAEKGRRGLNTMPVTAVLTAVLKEQKKTIAEQDEFLNTLEKNVQSLKSEIATAGSR